MDSLTKLTSTAMVPDRSRAPKMISKEPIRKRNTASAIALYGTFGGLFLNCEVSDCWAINRHRQRREKLIRQPLSEASPLMYSSHRRLWDTAREPFIGFYLRWIAIGNKKLYWLLGSWAIHAAEWDIKNKRFFFLTLLIIYHLLEILCGLLCIVTVISLMWIILIQRWINNFLHTKHHSMETSTGHNCIL